MSSTILKFKSNYSILFGICALILINSFGAKFTILGLITGIIETFFLIYLLIAKPISYFLLGSIILLSTNIDNFFALGDTGTILYSIYFLPFFKSYVLFLIMFCATVKCFITYGFQLPKRFLTNGYHKFYLITFIFFFIGILQTLIVLLLNDNGMLFHCDMWRYIARDFYKMITVTSISVLIWYTFKNNLLYIYKVKQVLLCILAAVTYSAVILILCGNYYKEWGNEYFLTCPLVLFFAPGLILFHSEKYGGFYLITGILSVFLQLHFTVGIAGTWWLYVIIIFICFFRKVFAICGKTNILLLNGLFIIIFSCLLYFFYTSEVFNKIQGQITYKLSTILKFFNGDGNLMHRLSRSGDSISIRIEEIVCSIIELVKKPYFLFFGKGYGGTVLHHWGWSTWNASNSSFPDIMFEYGTYSTFHLALSEVIINYGIIGIIMI